MRKLGIPLIVALYILFCFTACKAEISTTENGIIGSWETAITSLNDSGEDTLSSNERVVYQFNADLTGKETVAADGTEHERNFTYSFENDILCITFESGQTWEFPCILEQDQLILTQNHQDIVYKRML